MATSTFLGYTIGLECWFGDRIKLISARYDVLSDDRIKVSLVAARNLNGIKSVSPIMISLAAFDDRPRDAYDSTQEAIWALDLFGLSPAAMSN